MLLQNSNTITYLPNELKDFIGKLYADFDSLSQAQKLLIFQLYTKMQLLEQGDTSVPYDDDDLETWISLGIFLKTQAELHSDDQE